MTLASDLGSLAVASTDRFAVQLLRVVPYLDSPAEFVDEYTLLSGDIVEAIACNHDIIGIHDINALSGNVFKCVGDDSHVANRCTVAASDVGCDRGQASHLAAAIFTTAVAEPTAMDQHVLCRRWFHHSDTRVVERAQD